MFLGKPERGCVRAVLQFLRRLQSSWVCVSRFPLENATLYTCWIVWNDVLRPSKSKGRAAAMQQKGYSVSPTVLEMDCYCPLGQIPFIPPFTHNGCRHSHAPTMIICRPASAASCLVIARGNKILLIGR